MNKPAFLTGGTSRGALKQDGEVLREYLKHPQPTTVLVLLAPYEKLDGRKGVVKDLKKLAVEVSAAPLDEPGPVALLNSGFKRMVTNSGGEPLMNSFAVPTPITER